MVLRVVWYFEMVGIVFWKGWCSGRVWYFEECGVREWCGTLKLVVFGDGVKLGRWWCSGMVLFIKIEEGDVRVCLFEEGGALKWLVLYF